MPSSLPHIKKSTANKLRPKRLKSSHKGQNGRVMIVGGSKEYYGAPLLAGLGALYSGADLVHLYVPECNFDAARSIYPDFVVHSYKGDYLTPDVTDEIVSLAKKKCDSILMGPGLGDADETVEAVENILHELSIPTVLDADGILALKRIKKFPLAQPIVITPHKNEFYHLIDREIDVNELDSKSIIFLRSLSMDLHINVLLKGEKDYISSIEGNVHVNSTGNAGMTVGGSGDVLAGIVASFLAQGLDAFDASRCAAFYNGASGDYLMKQKGVNFSASDIAMALPYVLR